jgi:hypothetical protein
MPVSRSRTPDAGTPRVWALDRFGTFGLTRKGATHRPIRWRTRAHARVAAQPVAEATLQAVAEPGVVLPLANRAAAE